MSDLGNIEELECILCCKLLYEPITIFCGHTFCRQCLSRSLDHTNQCPLCRQIIHLDPLTAPTSIVLQNVIEKLVPEKYQERKREIELEAQEVKHHLPLFGLSVSCFPGQSFPMHIFEPRYRLMIRRVLQGSRCFGLVGTSRDPSAESGYQLHDIGCCLQIKQCQYLPDGRSLINTRGTKRFKILEKWEMDGYLVGRVEFLDDILPGDDTRQATLDLIKSVEKKVQQFVESCSRASMLFGELERVIDAVNKMPNIGDTPEEWNRYSYWVLSILPISASLQYSLLGINSLTERLETANILLERGIINPMDCSMPPPPSA